MKDYKKILEGVVDIINTTEKSDIGFANICSYIGENCPELKESENERIRKELLDFCKNRAEYYPNDPKYKNISAWITWLEKQWSEPVEINPTEFDTRLQALIGKFDSLPKEELIGSLSFWLNVVQNDGIYKPAEKQGKQKPIIIPKFKIGDIITEDTGVYPHKKIEAIENENYIVRCLYTNSQQYIPINTQDEYILVEQKPKGKFALEAAKEEKVDNQNCVNPADKVEPKFKVGNWYQCVKDFFGKGVTFDKNTAYYCAKEGCLQDEYGCHIAIVKDLYDNFKLWTIQDVKDGDVLACNNGWTCIFKTLVNDETFSSYCFMDNTKWFCETGSECHTLKEEFVKAYNGKIYPATKEQRDTLEKAMADAGYTFDFDKKELRKLKFRVGDKIKTINEEPLTITKIDEKGYWSEDLFICGLDSECIWDLVEQKSTEWSEEDERLYRGLHNLIYSTPYCDSRKEFSDWFKSLKDRIQLKQEWDEEDEKCCSIVIAEFSKCAGKSVSKDEWMRCNDWLNSLRDRVQPKQEWSEEDNKKIKQLLNIVNALGGVIPNVPNQYELIEFIKSFRPQTTWKPSDEQMEALWNVYQGGKEQTELATLYTDLKKLRNK